MAANRYIFPSRKDRTETGRLQIEEALNTRIGKEIQDRLIEHSNESGVHPLRQAHDAFASRALLAQTAEKTLDIQYYIWKKDLTGTLMFKAIVDAAKRGVRVRLLLDDNGINGLDESLIALNRYSNIDVRLFNPFSLRWPKWMGSITNFTRLNRRMHNKSFTADNQASIVGGRNIGDEYFGAGTGQLFADLDVLLIGQVVQEISEDFDTYWNNTLSIPIDQIVKNTGEKEHKKFSQTISEIENKPEATEYIGILRDSNFIRDLFSGNLDMVWADVRLVSDNPSKILDKSKPDQNLIQQIQNIVGEPQKELILVSPYFVPAKAGVEVFRNMVKRGVSIRILTNSLQATDVKVVHAGYEKRRIELLKAGIQLHEMKRFSDDMKFREQAGPFGSSGSSLHAKTFSVDGQRVFVGSFNFDQRSLHLNTEMGVVIESSRLANDIREIFEQGVPENSYEVSLNENGKIQWIEYTDEGKMIHKQEPETNLMQLIFVRFFSMMPIERFL
ncbi:phospholipase D family protein [Rhodohalobacter sp. SW132]|uniref:phospholipase D family protein n=1 Tax=Rhodohalobacter sp. SW132 TaxID=2293433 RepID=UPI000E26E256|nr:phospholipase D family protein [Rhodohalobacter sp. SW132]REL38239.1 phospholipase D family protein [Rhodohalobacter sp. SW132]